MKVAGRFWNVFEVNHGSWWAVDERSGMAYEVQAEPAEQLWRRHDLLTIPLAHALALVAQTGGAQPSFIDLTLLETTTRVTSNDASLIDEVAKSFGGARAELRSAPDHIIELTGGADVQRLHRSAPDGRAGVSVRRIGHDEPFDAVDLPAWPPLGSPALAGRFVGLHAALVEASSGAVLICGAQRAGKTTAALLAERTGFGAVLTDELVLLDRLGNSCGVPIPIRERSSQGRVARAASRSSNTGRLIDATTVVVLESADAASIESIKDVAASFRLVAPHLRAIAADLGPGIAAALALLGRCKVLRWRVRGWPDLAEDLVSGFAALERSP